MKMKRTIKALALSGIAIAVGIVTVYADGVAHHHGSTTVSASGGASLNLQVKKDGTTGIKIIANTLGGFFPDLDVIDMGPGGDSLDFGTGDASINFQVTTFAEPDDFIFYQDNTAGTTTDDELQIAADNIFLDAWDDMSVSADDVLTLTGNADLNSPTLTSAPEITLEADGDIVIQLGG